MANSGYRDDDIFKPLNFGVEDVPQRQQQPAQGYSHPQSQDPRDYVSEPQLNDGAIPKSVQAALISGGRAVEKLGRGVQQTYYAATGNDPQLKRLASAEADSRAVMAPIDAHYPIASGIGSALPQMAIPFGGAAVNSLGGAAKLFAQGAAVPALSYGTTGERAGGAIVGGLGNVVGSAIGQAVGKVMRPVDGAITPESEALARYMKDAYGVTTLPGAQLGNRRLQRFEAQLPNQLGSSNAASDLMEANQRGFNRAAASAINQNANNVGDAVRKAAQDEVSQGYEALAARAPKTVDLGSPVNRAAFDAYKNLTEGRLKKPPQDTLDALQTIMQASWGKSAKENQKTLSAWVSDIGEMQRDALTSGNKSLAGELAKVKNALNDARYAQSPPGDRAIRSNLDKQQATLYTIDNMRKTGAIDDIGNVQIGRVDTTLRKNIGRRTGAIDDPLSTLAEYNARFPRVSDSGTAANAAAMGVGTARGSEFNPFNWPSMAARNLYLQPGVQEYIKYGASALLPKTVRQQLDELMAAQYGGMNLGLKQLPASVGGLLGSAVLPNAAGAR